jgi:hypothetical protein
MEPLQFLSQALSLGSSIGGALMKTAGERHSLAMQERAMKLRNFTLKNNADMALRQSTFEQNRVSNQLDSVFSAQVGTFAGGNLDPTSGSPAILQLQSAAQAETDRQLLGARGAGARADAYGEMAGNKSRFADAAQAAYLNTASTWLQTGTEWIDKIAKSSTQAGGATAGGNGFGF